VRVISEKRLREFWQRRPDSEDALRAWNRLVKRASWEKFADVKKLYRTADQVGRCVVFNIRCNRYRLVAVIHYNRGIVYIRHVLTHREYDKGDWKRDCQCQ
jgi:mRNA interferase HigB